MKIGINPHGHLHRLHLPDSNMAVGLLNCDFSPLERNAEKNVEARNR